MCNGFGAIVTAESLYFCEPDAEGNVSHSDILRRLGWPENSDQFLRRFVRVECADWTMASFMFDEDASLPGWVNEAEVLERVGATLTRLAPAWAAYQAATAPAWAAYEAATAPAWAAYQAARNQALAAYQAAKDQALAAYEAAKDQALAAYEAATAQALAAYEAAIAPAWAAYQAAKDQALAAMIAEFSPVPGYVPAKKAARSGLQ